MSIRSAKGAAARRQVRKKLAISSGGALDTVPVWRAFLKSAKGAAARRQARPYINMDGDPSFDLKGACAAAAAGLKITGAPDRERAYLLAAATWCPEYQPQAYVSAMRKLATAYPDDPDAQTIFAESLLIPARWHWYSAAGTPAPGVAEAEQTLEGVMRRWPQHPGANHYYVHAVESSFTPERAVPSAQRLMGVVPEAGHIVHMPAHIWLLIGDWETAATVNERAVALDEEYFHRTGVAGGTYGPYYLHDIDFILYARSMQGRKGEAFQAAGKLEAALAPMASAMPEMADSFAALVAFTYARFRDWDRILQIPEPKPEMKASLMTWRFVRALALSGKGDRAAAAQEKALFEQGRQQLPADAPWGQNKAVDVASLASQVLDARLAATPQEAIPHWRNAVEIQDHLVYDEPPPWYYPVRESLGAALLQSGNAAEAEKVFREGVKRSPHNGRMLFGLLESLDAQGKQVDAGWVRREYEAAWARADVELRLPDL